MPGYNPKKNIKNFMKPRLTRVSKQGYFIPGSPEKYMGDPNKIIFRSSWELKFMQFCDNHPKVNRWSSEPIGIPYFSPLDQRVHTYYVDFYVVYIDADGTEHPWLIEVKPNKYVSKPQPPDRMTEKQMANFVWASKQYIVNQAKFQAAKEFAIDKGVQFGIVTENFLFKGV